MSNLATILLFLDKILDALFHHRLGTKQHLAGVVQNSQALKSRTLSYTDFSLGAGKLALIYGYTTTQTDDSCVQCCLFVGNSTRSRLYQTE